METEARPMVEGEAEVVREVDLRYAGQGYELTIGLDEPSPQAGRDWGGDLVTELRQRFEDTYSRRYGFAASGEPVEATTWRLAALGRKTAVTLPRFERQDVAAQAAGSRQAYFPECAGFCETPVFDRYELAAGQQLTGP